jgi:Mrp family chromosome partitioning ATPase
MIVVAAGMTRMEALDRSLGILRDAGGKLLGIVLNRFDPKDAYGTYYGSDKYGHYDNKHSYYHQNEVGDEKS